MGKLSFAIALNLLTDGVKKGAAEAQNIVKNLTSKITRKRIIRMRIQRSPRRESEWRKNF